MLEPMITLNKDQALFDLLGNLRVECITITEDGSYAIYYDQVSGEFLLCGHWALIGGDDDLPEIAFRPRPVLGRGKTLGEVSALIKKIYSDDFWGNCRIHYLYDYGPFENELFKEWKRLGVEEFDPFRFEAFNNTAERIKGKYQYFLENDRESTSAL